MQKLLLFITTILLAYNSYAFTLSKDAEISILTCSPGTELYSLFGHTAIRVSDPAQGFDNVFNYGTFDFDTPGFYLKYAQGKLLYQLTGTSYSGFLNAYKMENRTVYLQTLHLDSVQKQKMFDLLIENYRPENRSYLYNFLFDNCTTRSRDIIQKSLPDKIEWQITESNKNFWNLLDEYLYVSPWVSWGIHTILGQPGTQKAETFQYMFLPDYLMYGLDSATYQGSPIADKAKVVYQTSEREEINSFFWNPFFVFTIGALLIIFLIQYFKSGKLLNAFTFLFFIFTGLLGVLIIFLGFFTAHPITAPNWNILWANPLNLIAIWFIFCKPLSRIIQWYLSFYMLLLVIALPVWFFAQPAVPLASIPLIILMLYFCVKQKRNCIFPNFRK